MTRALLALLALLLVIGCAPKWKCDGSETYCVDGVPFEFRGSVAEQYAGRPEIGERLAAQLAVARGYWGVSRSDLDDWRFVYAPGPIDCNGETLAGCWDKYDRTVMVGYWNDVPGCIEWTPMPHEVGHFADESHESAPWCGWAEPLENVLDACGDTGMDPVNLWNRMRVCEEN